MQDEDWAVNKSKDVQALTKHVALYSILWLPVAYWIFKFDFNFSCGFVVVTFLTHFTTDYFSSKVTSRMFVAGKFGTHIPNTGAFSVIGFDQMLHYYALFVTYYYFNSSFV